MEYHKALKTSLMELFIFIQQLTLMTLVWNTHMALNFCQMEYSISHQNQAYGVLHMTIFIVIWSWFWSTPFNNRKESCGQFWYCLEWSCPTEYSIWLLWSFCFYQIVPVFFTIAWCVRLGVRGLKLWRYVSNIEESIMNYNIWSIREDVYICLCSTRSRL